MATLGNILKAALVCGSVVVAYILFQLYREQNSPEGRAAAENKSIIHVAEVLVKTRLRDPDSAQFLGNRVVRKNGKEAVCGFVDAKNGFSGMSGEQGFVVIGSDAIFTSDGPSAFGVIDRFCSRGT